MSRSGDGQGYYKPTSPLSPPLKVPVKTSFRQHDDSKQDPHDKNFSNPPPFQSPIYIEDLLNATPSMFTSPQHSNIHASSLGSQSIQSNHNDDPNHMGSIDYSSCSIDKDDLNSSTSTQKPRTHTRSSKSKTILDAKTPLQRASTTRLEVPPHHSLDQAHTHSSNNLHRFDSGAALLTPSKSQQHLQKQLDLSQHPLRSTVSGDFLHSSGSSFSNTHSKDISLNLQTPSRHPMSMSQKRLKFGQTPEQYDPTVLDSAEQQQFHKRFQQLNKNLKNYSPFNPPTYSSAKKCFQSARNRVNVVKNSKTSDAANVLNPGANGRNGDQHDDQHFQQPSRVTYNDLLLLKEQLHRNNSSRDSQNGHGEAMNGDNLYDSHPSSGDVDNPNTDQFERERSDPHLDQRYFNNLSSPSSFNSLNVLHELQNLATPQFVAPLSKSHAESEDRYQFRQFGGSDEDDDRLDHTFYDRSVSAHNTASDDEPLKFSMKSSDPSSNPRDTLNSTSLTASTLPAHTHNKSLNLHKAKRAKTRKNAVNPRVKIEDNDPAQFSNPKPISSDVDYPQDPSQQRQSSPVVVSSSSPVLSRHLSSTSSSHSAITTSSSVSSLKKHQMQASQSNQTDQNNVPTKATKYPLLNQVTEDYCDQFGPAARRPNAKAQKQHDDTNSDPEIDDQALFDAYNHAFLIEDYIDEHPDEYGALVCEDSDCIRNHDKHPSTKPKKPSTTLATSTNLATAQSPTDSPIGSQIDAILESSESDDEFSQQCETQPVLPLPNVELRPLHHPPHHPVVTTSIVTGHGHGINQCKGSCSSDISSPSSCSTSTSLCPSSAKRSRPTSSRPTSADLSATSLHRSSSASSSSQFLSGAFQDLVDPTHDQQVIDIPYPRLPGTSQLQDSPSGHMNSTLKDEILLLSQTSIPPSVIEVPSDCSSPPKLQLNHNSTFSLPSSTDGSVNDSTTSHPATSTTTRRLAHLDEDALFQAKSSDDEDQHRLQHQRQYSPHLHLDKAVSSKAHLQRNKELERIYAREDDKRVFSGELDRSTSNVDNFDDTVLNVDNVADTQVTCPPNQSFVGAVIQSSTTSQPPSTTHSNTDRFLSLFSTSDLAQDRPQMQKAQDDAVRNQNNNPNGPQQQQLQRNSRLVHINPKNNTIIDILTNYDPTQQQPGSNVGTANVPEGGIEYTRTGQLAYRGESVSVSDLDTMSISSIMSSPTQPLTAPQQRTHTQQQQNQLSGEQNQQQTQQPLHPPHLSEAMYNPPYGLVFHHAADHPDFPDHDHQHAMNRGDQRVNRYKFSHINEHSGSTSSTSIASPRNMSSTLSGSNFGDSKFNGNTNSLGSSTDVESNRPTNSSSSAQSIANPSCFFSPLNGSSEFPTIAAPGDLTTLPYPNNVNINRSYTPRSGSSKSITSKLPKQPRQGGSFGNTEAELLRNGLPFTLPVIPTLFSPDSPTVSHESESERQSQQQSSTHSLRSFLNSNLPTPVETPHITPSDSHTHQNGLHRISSATPQTSSPTTTSTATTMAIASNAPSTTTTTSSASPYAHNYGGGGVKTNIELINIPKYQDNPFISHEGNTPSSTQPTQRAFSQLSETSPSPNNPFIQPIHRRESSYQDQDQDQDQAMPLQQLQQDSSSNRKMSKLDSSVTIDQRKDRTAPTLFDNQQFLSIRTCPGSDTVPQENSSSLCTSPLSNRSRLNNYTASDVLSYILPDGNQDSITVLNEVVDNDSCVSSPGLSTHPQNAHDYAATTCNTDSLPQTLDQEQNPTGHQTVSISSPRSKAHQSSHPNPPASPSHPQNAQPQPNQPSESIPQQPHQQLDHDHRQRDLFPRALQTDELILPHCLDAESTTPSLSTSNFSTLSTPQLQREHAYMGLLSGRKYDDYEAEHHSCHDEHPQHKPIDRLHVIDKSKRIGDVDEKSHLSSPTSASRPSKSQPKPTRTNQTDLVPTPTPTPIPIPIPTPTPTNLATQQSLQRRVSLGFDNIDDLSSGHATAIIQYSNEIPSYTHLQKGSSMSRPPTAVTLSTSTATDHQPDPLEAMETSTETQPSPSDTQLKPVINEPSQTRSGSMKEQARRRTFSTKEPPPSRTTSLKKLE